MLGFGAISSEPISAATIQNIFAGGIASSEAFGTAQIPSLGPDGIVSEEAFGLAIVSLVPLITDTWIVRFR